MNNVDVIKDKNDIEKIKKSLIKGEYRNYLMFIIGINSGLRITQILSLKFSDLIDEQNNILDKISFKSIDYPINDCIKQAIECYVKYKNFNYCRNSFIFKSKKGDNPIERTQAYRILRNACKDAEININLGTHTLRKTFGYHFYMEYKDLKYLQKLFNHTSINMTMNYIGIEEKDKKIKYSSFKL
ncbi:MAG: tyrosine-type recombinase/integrase [Clostridium sp.]|uniref:tyrosine-type recombinase/integrase n=1 Tax=Clostridium sp. TaxID=1506 RepID=UPI0025C41309|nr:tyrosine-type recombinase/integrase [Clostridium sp.]MCE5220245.1 tyrosine-type recombinase/integrase [Clostridium sp.]